MNNLVAKHARTYNKAHTFRDRTKYVRNKDWLDEIEPPLIHCIVN